MYYGLSIGTNINQRVNAVEISKCLCEVSLSVIAYPFLWTAPFSIDTKNKFLNSVFIVDVDATPDKMKALTNSIEEQLGRNRKSPLSSVRDRVADIDIIFYTAEYDSKILKNIGEPYLKEVVLNISFGEDLSDLGFPLFKGPTAINYDTCSGSMYVVR